MARLSIRAALALALAVAGFLCAFALAGCGGSGNVAGEGPTRSASVSVTRPGSVTRDTATRETVAQDPTVTVTQSQAVLTTTQVRPTVTTQPTTVQVTTQPTTVQLTVTGSTQPSTIATESTSPTPNWVWVLLIVAAGAAIGLVVALLRRDRPKELSGADRWQAVAAAITNWTAQGWEIESQAESSAILRRDGELVVVDVDAAGNVSARPLSRAGDPDPS
jgi:hypothetical protein